jgi:hypothetical protein
MKEKWNDWDVYRRDWCPRFGWKCPYCGFVASDYLSFRQLSVDHIIPKHDKCGGQDVPGNRLVVCKRCNELKGKFDPRGAGSNETCPTAESLQVYIETVRRWMVDRDLDGWTDYERMMRELWTELPASTASG